VEEYLKLADEKFQFARHLYEVGREADPMHGALYHAYGNMELVSNIYMYYILYTLY
jgi:hypothetical protein